MLLLILLRLVLRHLLLLLLLIGFVLRILILILARLVLRLGLLILLLLILLLLVLVLSAGVALRLLVLLLILILLAAALLLLLIFFLLLILLRRRRRRLFRVLFQTLDLLFHLFEVRARRFILRIQRERRFVMGRRARQILQRLIVSLIDIGAVLQRATKIKMRVLLDFLVRRQQCVAERLQRFVVIAHLERGRAGVEFDSLLLR